MLILIFDSLAKYIKATMLTRAYVAVEATAAPLMPHTGISVKHSPMFTAAESRLQAIYAVAFPLPRILLAMISNKLSMIVPGSRM